MLGIALLDSSEHHCISNARGNTAAASRDHAGNHQARSRQERALQSGDQGLHTDTRFQFGANPRGVQTGLANLNGRTSSID